MTRLLDWCVPASALTWGRLTKVWPWNATHGMDPKMVPPGVSVHCIDPHCTACAPWLGWASYDYAAEAWPMPIADPESTWPDPDGHWLGEDPTA